MTEVLDRKTAIKNNTDPFGTKWGISLLTGYGLYVIGHAPESLDETVKVPDRYPHINGESSGMDCKFTRPEYAQKAIESYLDRAWDFSEVSSRKKERKEYAEKVA